MAVAQNHETILRYHNGNLTELNQIRLLQWYKTVVENETISFLNSCNGKIVRNFRKQQRNMNIKRIYPISIMLFSNYLN